MYPAPPSTCTHSIAHETAAWFACTAASAACRGEDGVGRGLGVLEPHLERARRLEPQPVVLAPDRHARRALLEHVRAHGREARVVGRRAGEDDEELRRVGVKDEELPRVEHD